MKALRHIRDGLKRHSVLTLFCGAAALWIAGSMVGEKSAASLTPPHRSAGSIADRHTVDASTASPFGPVALAPAADAAPDSRVSAPATTLPQGTGPMPSVGADARDPAAEVAQAPAQDTAAATPPVIAPAGMKDVEPPPLYAVHVPEPSDIDADGQNASAALPPAQVSVPAGSLSGLGQTAKVADTPSATAIGAGSNTSSAPGQLDAAAAASQTVSVYTPAQIKQAYGFSALPAPSVSNKMAYQGSGQTIIIVDAFHNPTAGADLNTFSLKFGIPTCALLPTVYQPATPITGLVAKPAAGSNCAFQVLYATAAGAQAATPPPVNNSWATEIALDVQWAHAVAPRAKIVLVEAASNSGGALMNAMVFARKLQGSSVISMSFGSPEFSSAPSYDYIMTGAGITWVASSGDSGAGTSWPATSVNVLGVGGTALDNVSPRGETAWSGSGGGRSLYVPMPGWQSGVTITGNSAGNQHRAVPDVAYNASPYSGFYIFRSGQGYLSVGGTSAGSPQWAGLVAVFNGVRALAGKAPLNSLSLHQALYNTAAQAANYPANFLDVTGGSNGACASCSATVGYDLVTGLGTPNVVALVTALAAL